MSAPQRAYGFVRICSMKGKRFARALDPYRVVLRAYRADRDLFLALLRLREIENLKLAWRALVRNAPLERWWPLWIDFEELATLPATRVRNVTSLHDLVEATRGTPYFGIARDVFAAHGDDLAPAEMAFDRWASAEVAREAARLPAEESLARQLAQSFVRARDAEIVQRAGTYDLSPAAVAAARVLPQARREVDVPLLCRRAFRGETFHLAPAVAFLIDAEVE